jgi:ABC-2 type transport system permease protein
MNFSTLFRLELKNFLGSRAALAAFLCLLVAGGYAMYHGKTVIDRQRAIIEQIPALQAEHIEKQLALSTGDLGNVLYYLQFSTVHEPSRWAAFSVGQRDVNPYNIKVRMLTLEGQIYDSEMSNPTNLLYGNFDLAFVVVFLFPLVVIAFCHNLISADQESGVWNLLRSQPVATAKIIGLRLALRFGVVLLFAFGLIAAGGFALGAPFDARFFDACSVAFAYLAFWFAVAALIISFQKSSTFNALSLLGVWIFLTILAPALLNLVISTAFPVSESFDVTVKQREGYHRKWDKPKAETMTMFYEKYPQYKDFPIPEDKFSWGWYYAMQNAGDEESKDATARYMEKLKMRDAWTNRAAAFLPTVGAQLSFNSLAKTDLQSHLAYLDAVRDYHRRIREFFYPMIFRNAKIEEVDWRALPKHEFKDEAQKQEFPAAVLPAMLFALFAAALARRNLAAVDAGNFR